MKKNLKFVMCHQTRKRKKKPQEQPAGNLHRTLLILETEKKLNAQAPSKLRILFMRKSAFSIDLFSEALLMRKEPFLWGIFFASRGRKAMTTLLGFFVATFLSDVSKLCKKRPFLSNIVNPMKNILVYSTSFLTTKHKPQQI